MKSSTQDIIYYSNKQSMNFTIGSEAWEQQQLVNWLEANNYKFTMICNDTWTPSFNQKKKNKALGLRPGMSDLIIILKRGNVLFLELKKEKGKQGGLNGSKISEYQLEWQEKINECKGSQYVIAHGYKQAILEIEGLEKIDY